MFRPAWVTHAQLTSALSAFLGQMPMTSSPRMLFQQEEVLGGERWEAFLQSDILSQGQEGKRVILHNDSMVMWLFWPLYICPSSCALPQKEKLPPSLSPTSLSSWVCACLREKWGLLQAHRTVVSFPLHWQGTVSYPANWQCQPSHSSRWLRGLGQGLGGGFPLLDGSGDL